MKKGDFVEIEFTGKTAEGIIFDTNVKEDAKKLNIENVKPSIISLGNKMFLEAIDEFLLDKEIGEKYSIFLTPDKAFGKRSPEMIRLMPIKIFHGQKVNPQIGMAFNFDGQIGKVISVSGGRVRVDFNNPIAGKDVIYNIKILRKVDDINEEVKAVMDFFFKREFLFEVNEKDKKILISLKQEELQLKPLFELLKDKFKEILKCDIEVTDKSNLPKIPEK